MAEFTKDIQTLTQQAGSSPQLQTNTGSLATDVVSAVGFGLGMYRQNKAATALAGAKKQQVEYQTRLDEGALAFSNFEASMLSQEQSGSTYRAKKNKFLAKLGDASFQKNVILEKNKMSGQTSSDVEKGLRNAEIARQEDAISLTNGALSGAIAAGLSADNVENKTDEEKLSLVRLGQIAEKERETRASILSNQIQSGAYDKMTNAKKTAAYLSPVMADFSANIASTLNTGVALIGGFGSNKKGELLQLVADQRTTLDAQVRQHVETAKSVGITLSTEQQNAFRQQAEGVLSSFEALMGQEAVSKSLAAISDRMLSENLVIGLSSANEKVRSAALVLTLKLANNDVKGTDVAENYRLMAGISKGNALPDDEDEVKEAVGLATDAFTAPANDDGSFTPEQKVNNKDIAVSLFQGTPAQVKKAVKGGGFEELVSSISETQGKNFAVEDHAEIAALVYDVGARSLSAAIAAAYNAPKSRMITVKRGEKQAVNTETRENFRIDENTLELVPIEGFVWINDEVKNYNSYIRKTIKALGDVGGDVEGFKRDAAVSVLSVR